VIAIGGDHFFLKIITKFERGGRESRTSSGIGVPGSCSVRYGGGATKGVDTSGPGGSGLERKLDHKAGPEAVKKKDCGALRVTTGKKGGRQEGKNAPKQKTLIKKRRKDGLQGGMGSAKG